MSLLSERETAWAVFFTGIFCCAIGFCGGYLSGKADAVVQILEQPAQPETQDGSGGAQG